MKKLNKEEERKLQLSKERAYDLYCRLSALLVIAVKKDFPKQTELSNAIVFVLAIVTLLDQYLEKQEILKKEA